MKTLFAVFKFLSDLFPVGYVVEIGYKALYPSDMHALLPKP